MSGPRSRSTPFDLAAAPRSCSRSRLPAPGMSRSMMNLRRAIISSMSIMPGTYRAPALEASDDCPVRDRIERPTDGHILAVSYVVEITEHAGGRPLGPQPRRERLLLIHC